MVRMSTPKRREQLLKLMKEEYNKAEKSLDFKGFTAEKLAQKAGISTVRFYKVAGDKFQDYCSKLPKFRRTRDEILDGLRQENDSLKKQVKELKKEIENIAEQDINEAIFLIEQLEMENIALREEIVCLKQQLSSADGLQHTIIQTSTKGSEQRILTVLEGGLKSRAFAKKHNEIPEDNSGDDAS